jgi:peptide chain release factor 2
MALLKAKMIRMEEEKREAEYAKKYDEKGDVSFGNQIRSYVLQPYQIVKDLRTNYEVGNPRAVLDGEIDGFVESYLRMKLAKGSADLAKA